MPGRTPVSCQAGSFPTSVCFRGGLIPLTPKVIMIGIIASIRNGTGLADHGVTFLLGLTPTSLMGRPVIVSQAHPNVYRKRCEHGLLNRRDDDGFGSAHAAGPGGLLCWYWPAIQSGKPSPDDARTSGGT